MRLRMAWLTIGMTFAVLYFWKGGGWPTLGQFALWVGGSLFVGTLAWFDTKARAHGEELGREFAERHRDTVHKWLDKEQ